MLTDLVIMTIRQIQIPVGNLFINSEAKEGPDSAMKGCRGFLNA